MTYDNGAEKFSHAVRESTNVYVHHKYPRAEVRVSKTLHGLNVFLLREASSAK